MMQILRGNDFSFTQLAVEVLYEKMIENELKNDTFVRLGASNHNNEYITYLMGFDEKTNNDVEFDIKGIKVIVQKTQIMYLVGMEIDWTEKDGQYGFIFKVGAKN